MHVVFGINSKLEGLRPSMDCCGTRSSDSTNRDFVVHPAKA
jgi:hypothetical protein